jgi:putative aldouronate transport system permease protein
MIQFNRPILQKRQKQYKRYRSLYLLLLIPIIHQLIFSYAPMYGVIIAFKDYNISKGIIGSDWVGFENFTKAFRDFLFLRAFKNTLILSFLSLLINFPLTIVFALLLNELTNIRFKKAVQTISYLPHFLSWVVVAGMIYQLLSVQVGVINWALVKLGIIDNSINFIMLKRWFRPIYIISGNWKNIGWGSIVYLAAIAGIDPTQYESAELEGANRFQKAIHITVPGILPTITILLILTVGRILNVGFDQIFNLYNASTYAVADVISTFVYRQGLIDAKYEYSTAIGLFQNVIGFILIMLTNYFAKKTNDYTLF